MATESTGSRLWLGRLKAVFEKDLVTELRTRYGLNAILIFALTSLVSVSFSMAGAPIGEDVQAALFWILVFFSAMAGLARVFVHEEERGTAATLRLSASSSLVFCGKFLFNLTLLLAVEALLVPLFLVLVAHGPVSWGLFFVTLALGSLGLSAAGTLMAAVVSRAGARTALFAGLAFPLLLPVLVTGVAATRAAFRGQGFEAVGGELRVLVSYAVVMFTAGLILFDFVWME